MAEIILKDCTLYYKPVGKEYQIIDGIHRLVAIHNVGDRVIVNMAPQALTVDQYREMIVSELLDIGIETWNELAGIFDVFDENKFKHAMWSLLTDGTIHRLPHNPPHECYVYGITNAGHERYD